MPFCLDELECSKGWNLGSDNWRPRAIGDSEKNGRDEQTIGTLDRAMDNRVRGLAIRRGKMIY
jgi:hypothetical protein